MISLLIDKLRSYLMRAFLLIFAIGFSSYIAASCISWGIDNYDRKSGLSRPSQTVLNNENTHGWSLINVFSSQLDQLQATSSEQANVLSYMFWPGQREMTLRKQLVTLQDILQLTPASNQDWLRLLAIQYELKLSASELEFSLFNVLTGADWHHKSSPSIIYYCFVLDRSLGEHVKALCNGVIVNYPWHTKVQHQARSMGVEVNWLTERLSAIRKIRGGSND